MEVYTRPPREKSTPSQLSRRLGILQSTESKKKEPS